MRGIIRIGLPALIVVLVAIQLVPVDRTNPPITAPLDGPPEVVAVLERCCYDCHSHATTWPWHCWVAPVSWLVAHDVHEGREKLNFSTWGAMRPGKRAHLAEEAWNEVSKGEMPLPHYLWLHPGARPSEADRRVIEGWSRSLAGATATGDEDAAGDGNDHDDLDNHDHDHDGH